jgi:hypothetical protein
MDTVGRWLTHFLDGQCEHGSQASHGLPERCGELSVLAVTAYNLGYSAMTEDKVVAQGAIGMSQPAGDGVDSGGVSIGLFGHPAAFFATDEPT